MDADGTASPSEVLFASEAAVSSNAFGVQDPFETAFRSLSSESTRNCKGMVTQWNYSSEEAASAREQTRLIVL